MAIMPYTAVEDECRRLTACLSGQGLVGMQKYDAFNEPRYTLTKGGKVIAEGNVKLEVLREAYEYIQALNRLAGKSG